MKKYTDKGNCKTQLLYIDLTDGMNKNLSNDNNLFAYNKSDLIDEKEIIDKMILAITTDKQYTIYKLFTKYGIKGIDIAKHYKVSEPNISKIISTVENKINKMTNKIMMEEEIKDKIYDIAVSIKRT